jgi:hypothetical protein
VDRDHFVRMVNDQATAPAVVRLRNLLALHNAAVSQSVI